MSHTKDCLMGQIEALQKQRDELLNRQAADKILVDAAMHLEFVALTPGPNVDNPSFQDVLIDMILYEAGGGDLEDWGSMEDYKTRLDIQRRERIHRAWSKLRHAIHERGKRIEFSVDSILVTIGDKIIDAETHEQVGTIVSPPILFAKKGTPFLLVPARGPGSAASPPTDQSKEP